MSGLFVPGKKSSNIPPDGFGTARIHKQGGQGLRTEHVPVAPDRQLGSLSCLRTPSTDVLDRKLWRMKALAFAGNDALRTQGAASSVSAAVLLSCCPLYPPRIRGLEKNPPPPQACFGRGRDLVMRLSAVRLCGCYRAVLAMRWHSPLSPAISLSRQPHPSRPWVLAAPS
jgi:hypothetical protein